MILAKDDRTGDLQLYGCKDYAKSSEAFGKNPTDAYGDDKFVLIGNQIEHNDIRDIAMTKGASFIITEARIE